MQTSTPFVLFVCSANVCRSPLAAAMFRQQLDRGRSASAVRVGSAGVAVDTGAARCEWSARNAPHDRDLDGRPGPRPLTSELLADATLVLAADHHVLSAVIRQSPRVRRTAFTIKEAAALAQLATNAVSNDHAGQPVGTRASRRPRPITELARLVVEMDAVRGCLPVEVASRSGLLHRTRRWSKVLDVPDAHRIDVRIRHKTMYAELAPAIDDLARAVTSAGLYAELRR